VYTAVVLEPVGLLAMAILGWGELTYLLCGGFFALTISLAGGKGGGALGRTHRVLWVLIMLLLLI
jgi:hypothetical protein